jgi:hypothetical protein
MSITLENVCAAVLSLGDGQQRRAFSRGGKTGGTESAEVEHASEAWHRASRGPIPLAGYAGDTMHSVSVIKFLLLVAASSCAVTDTGEEH